MRFSEEKIKQAILHPRLVIRRRAVRYFDDCYSEDEGIVTTNSMRSFWRASLM